MRFQWWPTVLLVSSLANNCLVNEKRQILCNVFLLIFNFHFFPVTFLLVALEKYFSQTQPR